MPSTDRRYRNAVQSGDFRQAARIQARSGDKPGAYQTMLDGLRGEWTGAEEYAREGDDPARAEAMARAAEEFRLWESAGEIQTGDTVTYVNSRARAKFKPEDGGGKVPVGTSGKVFWQGTNETRFGVTHKVGVESPEGNFFTALKNVECASPWDKCFETLAGPWGGVVPVKGTDVQHATSGARGKVFWVRGKRYGVRVGNGRDEVFWASLEDLIPPVPYNVEPSPFREAAPKAEPETAPPLTFQEEHAAALLAQQEARDNLLGK